MSIYLGDNNITGGFTAEEKKQFNNSINLINEQIDTKLNKTDANKLNCVTIDNVSLKEYILTNFTETQKTYYLIANPTCTDLPKASNFYITVETPGLYTYKVTAKELNDSNGKYVCTYRTISSTWTAWQELATMDRVKDGYAKILKNKDTDTNEAMFIAYKNRDLFGLRMYKNDDSEHELKFSASGISYVKNGVTVWTTRVADVPNTVIVSENTKVKLNSNCYYTVINGVCYVTLWGFTCTEAGQHVVNSSMPKTKLTMKGICTYGPSGNEAGCAYVLHDGNGNNKLYIEVKTENAPLYGSFSYPVAE